MKIDTVKLVSLCHNYGVILSTPAGIDGIKLLWALAGNESSFGGCFNPRHEAGYCPIQHHDDQGVLRAGRWSASPEQQQLHREWGCLACCSFGPWQIMAVNAKGYTPLELLTDLDSCAEATVAFINREIFAVQKATTLSQIADAYNSGDWRDKNVPQEYVDKLFRNYAVQIPN